MKNFKKAKEYSQRISDCLELIGSLPKSIMGDYCHKSYRYSNTDDWIKIAVSNKSWLAKPFFKYYNGTTPFSSSGKKVIKIKKTFRY